MAEELNISTDPSGASVSQNQKLKLILENYAGTGLFVTDGERLVNVLETCIGDLDTLPYNKESLVSNIIKIKQNNDSITDTMVEQIKTQVTQDVQTDIEQAKSTLTSEITGKIEEATSTLNSTIDSSITNKVDEATSSLTSDITNKIDIAKTSLESAIDSRISSQIEQAKTTLDSTITSKVENAKSTLTGEITSKVEEATNTLNSNINRKVEELSSSGGDLILVNKEVTIGTYKASNCDINNKVWKSSNTNNNLIWTAANRATITRPADDYIKVESTGTDYLSKPAIDIRNISTVNGLSIAMTFKLESAYKTMGQYGDYFPLFSISTETNLIKENNCVTVGIDKASGKIKVTRGSATHELLNNLVIPGGQWVRFVFAIKYNARMEGCLGTFLAPSDNLFSSVLASTNSYSYNLEESKNNYLCFFNSGVTNGWGIYYLKEINIYNTFHNEVVRKLLCASDICGMFNMLYNR